MGSADLMKRNLGERIETLLHVRDNRIANEIIKIFLMNWYDKNNLIEDKINDQFIYLNSLIKLESEVEDERTDTGSIRKIPESSSESI
jgi:polyphosphate kinase